MVPLIASLRPLATCIPSISLRCLNLHSSVFFRNAGQIFEVLFLASPLAISLIRLTHIITLLLNFILCTLKDVLKYHVGLASTCSLEQYRLCTATCPSSPASSLLPHQPRLLNEVICKHHQQISMGTSDTLLATTPKHFVSPPTPISTHFISPQLQQTSLYSDYNSRPILLFPSLTLHVGETSFIALVCHVK